MLVCFLSCVVLSCRVMCGRAAVAAVGSVKKSYREVCRATISRKRTKIGFYFSPPRREDLFLSFVGWNLIVYESKSYEQYCMPFCVALGLSRVAHAQANPHGERGPEPKTSFLTCVQTVPNCYVQFPIVSPQDVAPTQTCHKTKKFEFWLASKATANALVLCFAND